VLILLGVASGLLLGVLVTCVWGLRKTRRDGAELLLVALTLLPIAYFWGADAWGWPTPGSIARSAGLLTRPADRALSVGTTIVTAVVVVALLLRWGVPRRLERWSGTSEEPAPAPWSSSSPTSAVPPRPASVRRSRRCG
jgi:hypothetical protein